MSGSKSRDIIKFSAKRIFFKNIKTIRPLTGKILILQPNILILRDNVDHLNKKRTKQIIKIIVGTWVYSIFSFGKFSFFYSQFVYTKKKKNRFYISTKCYVRKRSHNRADRPISQLKHEKHLKSASWIKIIKKSLFDIFGQITLFNLNIF